MELFQLKDQCEVLQLLLIHFRKIFFPGDAPAAVSDLSSSPSSISTTISVLPFAAPPPARLEPDVPAPKSKYQRLKVKGSAKEFLLRTEQKDVMFRTMSEKDLMTLIGALNDDSLSEGSVSVASTESDDSDIPLPPPPDDSDEEGELISTSEEPPDFQQPPDTQNNKEPSVAEESEIQHTADDASSSSSAAERNNPIAESVESLEDSREQKKSPSRWVFCSPRSKLTDTPTSVSASPPSPVVSPLAASSVQNDMQASSSSDRPELSLEMQSLLQESMDQLDRHQLIVNNLGIAPDFVATDHRGKRISLYRLLNKGKKVILYFYPKGKFNYSTQTQNCKHVKLVLTCYSNLFVCYLTKNSIHAGVHCGGKVVS